MTTTSQPHPRFRQQPHGISRWFLRFPILLYRLKLGWLLGYRFLLLDHTGRKSGNTRQTVLEVIQWDDAARTPTVVSGFGRKSDWFLNVCHTPKVNVRIGKEYFAAEAIILSTEAAALEFREYAIRNPRAMKALASTLGYPWDGSEESCYKLAQLLPVLTFRPTDQ
jgi:deazaflavin-dependent oxidoreductase (nitroreductase family)